MTAWSVSKACLLAVAMGTLCGCTEGEDGTKRDGAPGDTGATVSDASTAVSDACKKYLSCLLAVQPGSYAAALTLYGETSACWVTPAQAKNCNEACVKEFGKIASGCACVGTDCKAGWNLPVSWEIHCNAGAGTCTNAGAATALVTVDSAAPVSYPCSQTKADVPLSPGKHSIRVQLGDSAGAALTTAAAADVTDGVDDKFVAVFGCSTFFSKPGSCCK